MLRRLGLALTGLILVALAAVVAPTGAIAASECVAVESSWVCQGGASVPGSPEEPVGGSGETPVSFTPGPQECLWAGGEDGPEDIDCSREEGSWNNEGQCYWSIADPQRAAPAGESESVGAWYECMPPYPECREEGGLGGVVTGCYGREEWHNSPPPGVAMYTPAQAAALLAASFTLAPVEIGLAPEEKVHSDDPEGTAPYRRTWVGIPVWAWVNNPTEATWGPISRSDEFGGVSITGTASVTALTWDTGDGQMIDCGLGTPFSLAYSDSAVDSPNCGWRYQQTSDGGSLTVSATTAWKVEWTGGGESGTIMMPTTTSSTNVRVGELQSVNVPAAGNN